MTIQNNAYDFFIMLGFSIFSKYLKSYHSKFIIIIISDIRIKSEPPIKSEITFYTTIKFYAINLSLKATRKTD